MNEKLKKRNPYPLKIEGQGSWSVEDTFLWTEMQFAVRKAMKSAEPEAVAFGKAVAPDGKEPPIEKVIAMIALNVNNRMYNWGASASLFLILKNVVSGVIKKWHLDVTVHW